MFRRVAFHNTATSLAYTADPRYHEADALYQVKTKKRRLRAYALSHERHKRGIAAVPLLSGVLFKLICNTRPSLAGVKISFSLFMCLCLSTYFEFSLTLLFAFYLCSLQLSIKLQKEGIKLISMF